MTLSEATSHYQSLLEGRRALTDHDPHELQQGVAAELAKARAAMEIAWLEANRSLR